MGVGVGTGVGVGVDVGGKVATGVGVGVGGTTAVGTGVEAGLSGFDGFFVAGGFFRVGSDCTEDDEPGPALTGEAKTTTANRARATRLQKRTKRFEPRNCMQTSLSDVIPPIQFLLSLKGLFFAGLGKGKKEAGASPLWVPPLPSLYHGT
jgi:hypothetical protein